jgi:hypothetical protein
MIPFPVEFQPILPPILPFAWSAEAIKTRKGIKKGRAFKSPALLEG